MRGGAVVADTHEVGRHTEDGRYGALVQLHGVLDSKIRQGEGLHLFDLHQIRREYPGLAVPGIAEVGFPEDGAGISVLPMGKHPKSSTGKRRGKRRSNGSYQGTNAEVAFILEYGSPRIGATHFMENTAEESEQEVYNTMDAELTRILRERGL